MLKLKSALKIRYFFFIFEVQITISYHARKKRTLQKFSQ